MREINTIVGLEVVGVADGKIVGRVTQVVYDLSTGRVEGLITGTGAAERGVRAEDILTIGADAVMVANAEAALRLTELPEMMDCRRDPEAPPLRAVTDDGQKLGQVSRVWIDPVAGTVTRYEVSAGLLRDLAEGPLMLPVVEGSTHGRDTLVLPSGALVELVGAHKGGLKAQMQYLSERVREQSAAARHSAEESAKSAREKLDKAMEGARKQTAEVAQKAREQTAAVAGKAKQQATGLAQKAHEGAAAVAQKAQNLAGRQDAAPAAKGEEDQVEAPECGMATWDEPSLEPVEGPGVAVGPDLLEEPAVGEPAAEEPPAEAPLAATLAPIPHHEEAEAEKPSCGTADWDEPSPEPAEEPAIEEEGEQQDKKPEE